MNSLQRIKQAFDNHGSQDNGKISSLAPYGVYVDPFYASPATTVRLSWSSEDYRASPAGFQLNTPPRRPYSHRKSYSSPPGSQTSPTAPLLPYSRLPDLISTRSTGAYQNYTVTRSHPSGYELVDEPISSPFNISVLSPTETATSIPETPLLTPTTDAPFFAPLNVDRVRSIVEQAKETNAGVAPGTSKDTSLHFKNQPFTVPEITITDDNKPGTQQSIYALNDFGWLLDYIGIDRPLSHFPPSVSTKASLDPSRVKAVKLFIKSARNTLARSGSKMGIDNPRLTTADGVHIIDKLKELEQFFHQGGVICTDVRPPFEMIQHMISCLLMLARLMCLFPCLTTRSACLRLSLHRPERSIYSRHTQTGPRHLHNTKLKGISQKKERPGVSKMRTSSLRFCLILIKYVFSLFVSSSDLHLFRFLPNGAL